MGLQRFSDKRRILLSARIGFPLAGAWNTQGDYWRVAEDGTGRIGMVRHGRLRHGSPPLTVVWEDDPKPPPLLADCKVSHEDMMAWLARVGD